jgi:hypothetical protein
MRRAVIWAAIVLAALVSDSARADGGSALEYKKLCELPGDGGRAGCDAVLGGYVLALVYVPQTLICLPSGFSVEQLRLVFLKFAAEHPEMLHEDFGAILSVAATRAFPCPSANRE